MTIQLRKDGLISLSEAFVCPYRRSPVLLVQPVWDIKCHVGVFKQIQLSRSTQVAFVSKYHAVAVLPLHIFKTLQVIHIGRSYVKGMDDTCNTTQNMELVAVIVHVLRCTIAPGWCMLYVILPIWHLLARAFWRTFTGLKSIMKTVSPPSISMAMYWRIFSPSIMVFFAALIELPTCNHFGNST